MSDSNENFMYLTFGDFLEVMRIGVWGHDAYKEKYTFSGAKGHFPDTEYRFTLCGDGSIAKDRYSDIYFAAKQVKVGFSTSLYRILNVSKNTAIALMQSKLDEANKVIEQQKADVARYQWLRDKPTWAINEVKEDGSPFTQGDRFLALKNSLYRGINKNTTGKWSVEFYSDYGINEDEDNLDAAIDAQLNQSEATK